jgi:hypothetical protein
MFIDAPIVAPKVFHPLVADQITEIVERIFGAKLKRHASTCSSCSSKKLVREHR